MTTTQNTITQIAAETVQVGDIVVSYGMGRDATYRQRVTDVTRLDVRITYTGGATKTFPTVRLNFGGESRDYGVGYSVDVIR